MHVVRVPDEGLAGEDGTSLLRVHRLLHPHLLVNLHAVACQTRYSSTCTKYLCLISILQGSTQLADQAIFASATNVKKRNSLKIQLVISESKYSADHFNRPDIYFCNLNLIK